MIPTTTPGNTTMYRSTTTDVPQPPGYRPTSNPPVYIGGNGQTHSPIYPSNPLYSYHPDREREAVCPPTGRGVSTISGHYGSFVQSEPIVQTPVQALLYRLAMRGAVWLSKRTQYGNALSPTDRLRNALSNLSVPLRTQQAMGGSGSGVQGHTEGGGGKGLSESRGLNPLIVPPLSKWDDWDPHRLSEAVYRRVFGEFGDPCSTISELYHTLSYINPPLVSAIAQFPLRSAVSPVSGWVFLRGFAKAPDYIKRHIPFSDRRCS